MSADLELVWPLSVPLLLLLGATAWLCVRCSRPGAKRNEKIFEQRNQQENEQNFTVAQTYSLARPVWPGPLMDTASDKSSERKNKLLFSDPEGPESLRYQNFYRGSRHEPDAAYVLGCRWRIACPGFHCQHRINLVGWLVPISPALGKEVILVQDPIPTDYYNWGRFQKSPEDDDSNSYENVLICKPSTPDSGGEESEDYQNSISIREWRESRRTVGAQVSPLESPDEEPDYVNGDVAAAEHI